jgi:hypothetical protein
MQTKLPLMAPMQRPPRVERDAVVRRLDDEGQAVSVAMKFAGAKLAFVAASLGVSESAVSLWRSGKRVMSDRYVDQFCITTGTTLLRQFRDLQNALAEATEANERRRHIDHLARMMEAA